MRVIFFSRCKEASGARRVTGDVATFWEELQDELIKFDAFGKETRQGVTRVQLADGTWLAAPTFINEFWTAKQRAANPLHEISYRACFKPQLPRFFVERLTQPGDTVLDPFMGRGTTLLEAALLGRNVAGCDINPLSSVMLEPRLNPPTLDQVQARLDCIDLDQDVESPTDLLAFYHPDTLLEICALRQYLHQREKSSRIDSIDKWIRMVALNRLTGHSPGFFSVYTMPPNQAVSVAAQAKINTRRKQTPPRRDVKKIILTKSRALLADCGEATRARLAEIACQAILQTADCENTLQLKENSITLVVTSPPFLDVVDYAADNWLRCWFIGVDAATVPLSILGELEAWAGKMRRVFRELRRILVPGGRIAFEVGEVRGGKILLEEAVIRVAVLAGLEPVLVLINSQQFTKTANTWGVSNNQKGTNTNRIVLLRKS